MTGKFLEDVESVQILKRLIKEGHYVGPHSDGHLLYATWENRDSLLVSKEQFNKDLTQNIIKINALGMLNIDKFVAPYEWYNKTIGSWTSERGLQLINLSPGLRTAADYTYPEMGNRYLSSDRIMEQLLSYEEKNGLHGFIVLVHIGTDPRRTDKFFNRLDKLITVLKNRNYEFVNLDEL